MERGGSESGQVVESTRRIGGLGDATSAAVLRAALISTFTLICACDGVVGELGEADKPPPMLPATAPRIVKLDCTPTTGFAPVDVTCQLEVVHPGEKPAMCNIEPGTGEQGMTVSDCLTPRQVTFRYTTAGTFTLKAIASDPDGASVNTTIPITLEVRPNDPPVIEDFTASVVRGGAPFTTTLTWRLSDPEGDALTCKLNDMPVDCANPGSWTVQQPGMVTVTLTVTDSFGNTTTRSVTLTAVMPVGDVRISKVEWGQSVILTDLKLVGQKPALLRVHVLADRAGLMGVTAEVTGKLGTTDLGKLTLTGPTTAPMMEAPSDLTQQWTATVPATWIEPNVELTLKIDAADALPETDEQNNTQVLRPNVGRATQMQLTAVPVMHQGAMPTVTNLDGPLTRVWPLKGVSSQTRAPYSYGGTLTAGGTAAWADLLDDIAQLRQMDGSNRNYYGFVRVTYTSGVAGIGYIGQEASVGRDDSIQTAQHELGHNMGRNHAPCGGVAGPDPNYPYAGARLGSWGYDAVARRLINPTSFVDLMSYCNPEWISDYNYRAVQRFLEAQPYVAPATSSPYVTAVAVSGRFTLNGVKLRPVHRVLTRLPTAEVPFTGRSLKVKFADGRERVVPIEAHEIADLDAPEHSFFALVEDLGPIAAIEVQVGGAVVLSQRAVLPVDAAPRVRVTRVSDVELLIDWDASLQPVLAVAHLASSSNERTTLALGLTGGTGRIRTDGLGDGKLELSLSNGLDAARLVVPLPAR